MASTDLATATEPLVRRDDLALMADALLGLLGYAGIGFFAAFLARSSGAAMGLFFSYAALLEQVLGVVLSQMGSATTMVAQLGKHPGRGPAGRRRPAGRGSGSSSWGTSPPAPAPGSVVLPAPPGPPAPTCFARPPSEGNGVAAGD